MYYVSFAILLVVLLEIPPITSESDSFTTRYELEDFLKSQTSSIELSEFFWAIEYYFLVGHIKSVYFFWGEKHYNAIWGGLTSSGVDWLKFSARVQYEWTGPWILESVNRLVEISKGCVFLKDAQF